MLVVVGLGNPGPRYRSSRHNVGFRVVDQIADQWSVRLNERRAKAVVGHGFYAGHEVALAKPRTFMNNSGEGIVYLLSRFRARPSDLLIIYDEMALPLGTLRIRAEGSDAGHNGIRSIIRSLGTVGFPRLRVGIGAPPPGTDSVPYVLGRFAGAETKIIDDAVTRAAAAVTCLLEESIDVAMNRFN